MKNKIYRLIYFFAPKKSKLFLKKLNLGYNLASLETSYLVQTGYVNSVINDSISNTNKESIPWMNYPFIDFLNEKLQKNLVVFEYGSGFSTIFFAKRTKKVISIEYNKDWYHKVKDLLKENCDNAEVQYSELNDSYVNAIERYTENEKCDIVVVDGRKRVKCAKLAYNHLSEKGVVIFDDSHREYYKEGLNFYKEKGYKSITFKGIKPTGFGTDQTTLLYKSNNCLGI